MKRLATLVVVLVVAAAPARANHSWNGYHWARTANPFTLKIVDSVEGVWDDLLPRVSDDWSASSVLDTTIEAGSTSLLTRITCSPVPGKIHACNAIYGPNGWLGLATVYLSGSHIVQATVRVNDFYFLTFWNDDSARRHVLCQEVGHDFGLQHQYTEPSCMDDRNGLYDLDFMDPGAHDYAQLGTVYAHLDPSGTVGDGGEESLSVRTEGPYTVVEHIFWAR